MTPPIKRLLVILLALVSSAQLLGCYAHHPVPREELVDPAAARITGVTTVGGDTVRFDTPKLDRSRAARVVGIVPVVRADTLHAQVDGAPYRLPVDQVQQYWVRSMSVGRTLGVVGASVGGVLVIVFMALAAALGP